MELRFSKIVSRDKKKAEILLYGDLGDDSSKGEINGHYFAQELNWLGKNYDEVLVRINSNGGDVNHGLSIVSEMRTTSAFIITRVDGVAASMGAFIAVNGDKVQINDYARMMVHAPRYVDENGETLKNLDSKTLKSLKNYKGILADVLGKRSIADEKVKEMFRTDAWFDADSAKAAGLVDEVLETGKKELAALAPMKLVARLNLTLKSQNNMKEVVAKLNMLGASLKDDATPVEIVAAINSYVKPAPVEAAKLTAKAIDALVAVGIKTGAIVPGDEGNEQTYRTLAAASPDVFVDLLNVDKLDASASAPQARISDLVANAKKNLEKGGPSKTVEQDFAWYEKNDPAALAKIESTQPELFAKLQAADNAKYQ